MIHIQHVSAAEDIIRSYQRLHEDRRLSRPAAFWERCVTWLGARPGQTLLDVAGGSGQLAAAARARGVQAWTVDLVRGDLQADGERLPLRDASFDRVANIGSLEHFPSPARGVAEMARVLAPDGLALVLLPNAYGLRGPVLHAWRSGEICDDGQPIQRYASLGEWRDLLVAGGLPPLRVHGCESLFAAPRRAVDWLDLLRHPSRVLGLAQDWLPLTMATEFIFLCRRAA